MFVGESRAAVQTGPSRRDCKYSRRVARSLTRYSVDDRRARECTPLTDQRDKHTGRTADRASVPRVARCTRPFTQSSNYSRIVGQRPRRSRFGPKKKSILKINSALSRKHSERRRSRCIALWSGPRQWSRIFSCSRAWNAHETATLQAK